MTPCKRHKAGPVERFRVVRAGDAGSLFAVVEWRKCVRCAEDIEPRIARGAIRRSRADALTAYGLTDQELQDYLKQHYPGDLAIKRVREALTPAPSKEPIEAPLTCWPFPVSAHQD